MAPSRAITIFTGSPEDSTEALGKLCTAGHHGVVDVKLAAEFFSVCGIVVHRDADDLQAARLIGSLPPHKAWSLFAARRAPAGPEIQQDNFTAIVSHAQRRSVQLRHCHVWHGSGRRAALSMARQKDDCGSRQQEHRDHPNCGAASHASYWPPRTVGYPLSTQSVPNSSAM